MKIKKTGISLLLCTALLLASVLPASALTLETPADALEQAFGASAVLADASFTPGLNAFTGTAFGVTFDSDADLDFITMSSGTSSRHSAGWLSLNEPSQNAAYYAYANLPCGTVDRPALAIVNVKNAMWTKILMNGVEIAPYKSGYTEVDYLNKIVDTGDTTAYNSDKVTFKINDFYSASGDYLDNLALIPYYQITYKNLAPDGTSAGADTVVYYLGTADERAAITTTNNGDGALSGLPTSYTIDGAQTLSDASATFLGWSTSENDTETVTTVALANEDVTLYPVWQAQGALDPTVLHPGINAFTGTDKAYTFDEADALDRFSASPRWDASATVDYGVKTVSNYGNSFWAKNTNGATDASGHFVVRYSAVANVVVDRPAYLTFRVHDACTQWGGLPGGGWARSNTTGDWANGVIARSYTEDEPLNSDTVTFVAWAIYSNNYEMCIDNFTLLPYYKITYKNLAPDGTSAGADVVKYDLDTANIDISANDGTIAGLPTAYTPDETLTAEGWTNVGWALAPNASAPLSEIPLANEDLTLYPVWVQGKVYSTTVINPGLNVYTATNKAITFDEANAMDRFTITPRWDKNATVDYGIASVGSYGKTLWFRNTNGVTDASGHFVVNVAVKADVTIDRPAYVIFRVRDACTLWGGLPGGGWARSNTSGNWDNGVIKATYTEDAPLNSDTINVQPWAVYSNKYEMFIDNFALIPYYKITYKNILPDGTTGEDTIGYELDTANISVDTADGVIAGLPTAFTPVESLEAEGYTFLGWSTKEGATAAMSEIPLENEDLTLYPVWGLDSSDNSPQMTMRDNNYGVRVFGLVSIEQRTDAVEYGFLVTRETLLGDKELTLDVEGVKYVKGEAYRITDGNLVVDKQYSVDENGVTFSGFLYNIPDSAKSENIVARPYLKAGAFTFYASPIITSVSALEG